MLHSGLEWRSWLVSVLLPFVPAFLDSLPPGRSSVRDSGLFFANFLKPRSGPPTSCVASYCDIAKCFWVMRTFVKNVLCSLKKGKECTM